MLYLAAVLPVRAADDTSRNGYELGVAFAMPAVGVSLRKAAANRLPDTVYQRRRDHTSRPNDKL
ncbi:hypothetical protein N9383_01480 [Granulosicoccus sp.]|nr:hypothetical protein [Granulosicoccus sp.]